MIDDLCYVRPSWMSAKSTWRGWGQFGKKRGYRGYSYGSPEKRTIPNPYQVHNQVHRSVSFTFLSIVLKDENHEKYLDIYNSLLFGRGPNRVIEMACFDSKSGGRHAIRSDATSMSAARCVTTQHLSSLHASHGKKSAV